MSTLDLLSLQRQSKQLERDFNSLKQQYKHNNSSNLNVDKIRESLLEIRKTTETELNEKNNNINHLNNIINQTKIKLKQVKYLK